MDPLFDFRIGQDTLRKIVRRPETESATYSNALAADAIVFSSAISQPMRIPGSPYRLDMLFICIACEIEGGW